MGDWYSPLAEGNRSPHSTPVGSTPHHTLHFSDMEENFLRIVTKLRLRSLMEEAKSWFIDPDEALSPRVSIHQTKHRLDHTGPKVPNPTLDNTS